MEPRFLLCKNPENVPSVSEWNRHFLWMSKPVNQIWVKHKLEVASKSSEIVFASILDHWFFLIKKRLKQKMIQYIFFHPINIFGSKNRFEVVLKCLELVLSLLLSNVLLDQKESETVNDTIELISPF